MKTNLLRSTLPATMWVLIAIIMTVCSVNVKAQCALQLVSPASANPDTAMFCISTCSQVVFYSPAGSYTNAEWQVELPVAHSVYGDSLTLDITNSNGFVSWVSDQLSMDIRFYLLDTPTPPALSDINTCGDVFDYTLNAGNSPATYLWSTGATTQTISATSAGTYWVDVDNGCGTVSDIMVLSVDHSNDANLGPDLVVCLYDTVTLTTGNTDITDYTWSTYTGNVPNIDIWNSGTYSVTTTDSSSCISVDTMMLTVLIPPTPEILVVSANIDYYSPSFGDNIVEWDSTLYTNGTMNIYRQVGGTYVPVGSTSATNGDFQDTASSEAQAQWYKIAYQDSCGNEGVQSGFFKSLKAWAYKNINDQVVVTWEPVLMESKSIQQYRVYKFVNGTPVQIGVANPGDISFTDLNPTLTDTNYTACAVIDTSAKSFLSLAFSNPTVVADTSSGINETNVVEFNIYPNPSSDVINIQSEERLFVTISDLAGRIIMTSSEKKINIDNIPSGIYTMKVMNTAGVPAYEKIIIN